ncbi:MAG: DUF1559 domain-containing protein [Planctomycetota bacterium]
MKKTNVCRRTLGIRGFTLVELLVVIAIIGILVCMLLPAVGSARETARRIQCEANLARLALAMQQFEMSEQHFPAGVRSESGPIKNLKGSELHQGWIISLLPYLDEPAAFEMIDAEVSVYDAKHKVVADRRIPLLSCPSAPRNNQIPAPSDYAGVHHHVEAPIDADNTGILFLNSEVTRNDITDGLQYTLLIGEKVIDNSVTDLGWMSGTSATLRNTGWLLNDPVTIKPNQDAALVVGGFGSWHSAGGAQFVMGNGSIDYIAGVADKTFLEQLAHRSDGSLITLE